MRIYWVFWTDDNVNLFPVIISPIENKSLKNFICGSKQEVVQYMKEHYPDLPYFTHVMSEENINE